jgi:glutathione S-transferase
MSVRPTLYSMPISHWCVSADRMLAYKGVGFDTVYVPYHDKTELIAATRQDYVPTLVWDGKPVMHYDIPDFLERTIPEPTLYPWGNKGLAAVIEQWAHAQLEEKVWRYVVTMMPPILRSDVERWVFEEMQVRGRGPWHVLLTRKEEFKKDMLKELGRLDNALLGREWILGEPSLADFGVYGSLSPILTVGESIPKHMPQLAAWVARIRTLGTTEVPPEPARPRRTMRTAVRASPRRGPSRSPAPTPAEGSTASGAPRTASPRARR